MKTETALIGSILAMGGAQYLAPRKNYNNGHGKYSPGNCPGGLTEEEKRQNAEIDAKRKAKKQKTKERREKNYE